MGHPRSLGLALLADEQLTVIITHMTMTYQQTETATTAAH